MSGLVKILLYFVASVALSLLVAPLVIKIMRKLKAKQTVLGYVKQHEHKKRYTDYGRIYFSSADDRVFACGISAFFTCCRRVVGRLLRAGIP